MWLYEIAVLEAAGEINEDGYRFTTFLSVFLSCQVNEKGEVKKYANYSKD